MVRVPFQTLYDEFYRVLVAVGFTGAEAELCAKLFAENQLLRLWTLRRLSGVG